MLGPGGPPNPTGGIMGALEEFPFVAAGCDAPLAAASGRRGAAGIIGGGGGALTSLLDLFSVSFQLFVFSSQTSCKK